MWHIHLQVDLSGSESGRGRKHPNFVSDPIPTPIFGLLMDGNHALIG